VRVAVTGSTGRLGRRLVSSAHAEGHEVLGLARTESDPCDLRDEATVLDRIRTWRPDLVVHAASSTDVDGCERDPAMARACNVDATRHVVEAARSVEAHVVFLSTNHVFDGTGDRPMAEDDPTNPRSVYAATKLAGEELAGPDATIVRTSWLSSGTASGIVAAILAAAAGPGPLRFATDEQAQPTFAEDLAPVLLQLGGARTAGRFHATGEGALSAFDLAREVLAEAGGDPARVEPILGADLPGRIAPRPRNGVLDTSRLRHVGGGLPHHLDSLRAALRDQPVGP